MFFLRPLYNWNGRGLRPRLGPLKSSIGRACRSKTRQKQERYKGPAKNLACAFFLKKMSGHARLLMARLDRDGDYKGDLGMTEMEDSDGGLL